MLPSLSSSVPWLVALLLLMQLVEVWSNCCSCPAKSCSIPQWPCCNKHTKWYNFMFG